MSEPVLPGQEGIPTDPERVPEEEDEAGPIGIFPSWPWVYGTVVVWAAVSVVLLWIFTVTFDHGAR